MDPIIVAHRGASGYRPEHSESAYRLAARLGADMIEPDLVASKDGVLVLRHENEISGTTDVADHPELAHLRRTQSIDGTRITGWFTEDLTWAQLQTLTVRERLPKIRQASTTFDAHDRILRLEDLLGILDETGLGLVAEIKHATHFASIGLPLDELLADCLREHGWHDTDRLVVESFEQDVLGRVRDRGIAAKYVYLVERKGAAPDLTARLGASAPDYASQIRGDGLARLAGAVDGVSLQSSLLFATGTRSPSGVVDAAHAAGLDVFTWTLRPENKFLSKPNRRGSRDADWGDWQREWAAILATGVDGIFADHPDLAAHAVAAHRA